ncbi:hypothetical protein KIN20_006914 [Parelaphostrongylus tenuis]|uniref:Uncharacterized protein n=1 Tax=Parelaphostrongylus tenuis TaxID=148309 RepID=A0AAD5QLE0_PARTN|nr:hypothetical protein KIN20_006914 [Parelaphostrongylus tenuis]
MRGLVSRLIPLLHSYHHVIVRHYCVVNVAREVKDILRIAGTGDLEAAIHKYDEFSQSNDVPDWGVVKFGSILIANGRKEQSEKLLRRHYEEYGGKSRFARNSLINEDQVIAALHRVLNSSSKEAVQNARRFYQWLLEWKFCSNKDAYISLFVQNALEQNGLDAALAELEQLKSLGRVKSLSRTFHLLLFNAVKHGAPEEISKVEAVIDANTPSASCRFKRFVLLELKKTAAFVESLQGNRLEHTHLCFMVELATKLKSVIVLEALCDLSLVLQLRPQEKAMIYDELVKFYGKHSDISNLERILDLVLHESESEQFTATLGRLAHFYRCLHKELPRRLQRAL